MSKSKSEKMQRRNKKASKVKDSLEKLINSYEQAKLDGNSKQEKLLGLLIERIKNKDN